MGTIIIYNDIFVKKSNEKRIQKYKLAYDKIINCEQKLEKLYKEVEFLLGEYDPITNNVSFAMSYIVDEAIPYLKKIIDTGKPLQLIKPLNVTFKPLSLEN